MDRHLEERDEEIEKKYSSSLGDLLRIHVDFREKSVDNNLCLDTTKTDDETVAFLLLETPHTGLATLAPP